MIQFAARTHPGRRSGENEDAIGWDAERQLWFVADGMGGHAAGAVASRTVRDALLTDSGTEGLSELVRKAHEAVSSAAAANPEHEGMGSTLVCARIEDALCSVVWVGDSRGYLWRQGALRRLTRDHSFAEIMSREQGLSATQIRSLPDGHVVTQTLGLGTPEPSMVQAPLRRGDWILLCSDGLTDELNDPAIAGVLAAGGSVDAVADRLVEGALNHGGHDNVSVVVIAYEAEEVAGRARRRAARAILLSIVSGAAVAVACAIAWWYFFGVR